MATEAVSKIRPPDPALPGIDQLVAIVAQLRAPGGCPWDREQTHASLRGGLLEEAYEVVTAIDNSDDENLREELGDLLLQSVFHAQIAVEEKRFNFDDVARSISEKLVRRHPHVFGEGQCADSDAVLKRWDEIKRAEKGGDAPKSVLDAGLASVPSALTSTLVTPQSHPNYDLPFLSFYPCSRRSGRSRRWLWSHPHDGHYVREDVFPHHPPAAPSA